MQLKTRASKNFDHPIGASWFVRWSYYIKDLEYLSMNPVPRVLTSVESPKFRLGGFFDFLISEKIHKIVY